MVEWVGMAKFFIYFYENLKVMKSKWVFMSFATGIIVKYKESEAKLKWEQDKRMWMLSGVVYILIPHTHNYETCNHFQFSQSEQTWEVEY